GGGARRAHPLARRPRAGAGRRRPRMADRQRRRGARAAAGAPVRRPRRRAAHRCRRAAGRSFPPMSAEPLPHHPALPLPPSLAFEPPLYRGATYLSAERGLVSWLTTHDHKRIGVMFLLSTSVALALGG